MTRKGRAIGPRLAALLVAAAAALAPAGSGAVEQEPKVLGTFNSWTAYVATAGGAKVCYIASQPIKEQGKYTKRGDILTLVTHSPGEKTSDVVSIVAGYTYKAESEVLVTIGGDKFTLFTFEDRAWAAEAETDKALVKAMRKGNRMVVVGTSSRGTHTTDTYSLIGFTKAYNKASAACGVTG